ncbi:MAG: NTP transferase domain-containing protein [Bacillota bacterium]|nr:NTP transferase domain-containing protein [Bacillota bacterium]
MDALILAGSINNGKLRVCSDVENEALIPIGKKTMIEYVVDAIIQSPYIKKIVVVGPPEKMKPLFPNAKNLQFVPGGDTVIKGVINGLKEINSNDKLLIVTSDIPLITGAVIDSFIQECLKHEEKELFYPIVPREVNDRKFPGVKRTYVKLKDGIYTGGNIFLVDPLIIPKCAAKAEEIVALRKSPFALAKLLGFSFIVKFVLKVLSISEAEKQVSRLLGVNGKAIISHEPEIGVDVDKPSDLEVVTSALLKEKR